MSSLLQQIGNTPIIDISALQSNPKIKIWAKLEGNNPGGSVKDRAAYNMIKSALERGEIGVEDHLVEATSGNTGIALAMIASLFKLSITLVMPETATIERIKTMKAYGANVVLTAADVGIEGARDKAIEFVQKKGYKGLNQFSNPDNWKAHYKTTGPEIWKDTEGQVSHFVSAMGTTGTIMGTSTYLKEKKHEIQIIGVQPCDGSKIPGIRKWSEDYLPAIFDSAKIDSIIEVSAEEAKATSQLLAKELGIFAGMSSGGAVSAVLNLAKGLSKATIVTVLCDRGDRYLSSDLFD